MIEMKHITKKYGDFTVFSDFSMEIPDGEVLCLMGKSGRGKTTLLRMLMELEQPDARQHQWSGRQEDQCCFSGR